MSGGNAKMPLFAAACCSCCAKPRISALSAVEASTTSTGNCPPPGSAGGTMGKVCTPGMAATFPCTSGRIWEAVRLRSVQGLRPTPQKPVVGCVTWKVNSDSGVAITTRLISRVECVTWSSVEFAGVFTMPKMTPWSSAGASSLGAMLNMATASKLTTAQPA